MSDDTCDSCPEIVPRSSCPDLNFIKFSVKDLRQQLTTLKEAINRTQYREKTTRTANSFEAFNISDFHDIYDQSSKLGRSVRRRASDPERLLHTSYMTLAMIQAYMSELEVLMEGPSGPDMADINNKTRQARCNLMVFMKQLGVNKLKKKFCDYKSDKKTFDSKTDIIDYFLSVMQHGIESSEKVTADLKQLDSSLEGCKYKNCGVDTKLLCRNGDSKKNARAMKKKRRNGKKGRKGRKGKGRKGKKDKACRGKKPDGSRVRHQSKKCRKSKADKRNKSIL